MRETRLVIDRFDTQTDGQLIALLQATFSGAPFHLIQTIHQLHFAPSLPSILLLENSLAGRVFNERTEVRWRRGSDGYGVWRITESVDDSNGHLLRAEPRDVYLLGRHDGDGRFTERHLAREVLRWYEWSGDFKLLKDDRLCFKVIEYMTAPYTGMDMRGLESALNVPRVLAHRVCGVGKGPDQEAPDGDD